MDVNQLPKVRIFPPTRTKTWKSIRGQCTIKFHFDVVGTREQSPRNDTRNRGADGVVQRTVIKDERGDTEGHVNLQRSKTKTVWYQ